MTRAVLNEANRLADELEWCDKVRHHLGKMQRLELRFDTTRECVESHDDVRCPDWLVELIGEAVRDYQKETEKELAEL